MTAQVLYLNHYRHELREFLCDRCGRTYEALAYHDTVWDWQTDAECPHCEEEPE